MRLIITTEEARKNLKEAKIKMREESKVVKDR
jgi:hypothetical protein